MVHLDQLVPILEQHFVQSDTSSWLDRMEAAGLPAGPVMTINEMHEDPQAQARDMIVETEHPVAGPVKARLWVSSDCADTDFTVKLIDVHPPSQDYPRGYAMLLTDGILRMRYRDDMAAPTPMEPGQVYQVEIEAFPTANRFLAGHRTWKCTT